MSTRRARIKAVAALPPRRKNQENAEGKNKPKENFEKTAKSPRTPRSLASLGEEKILSPTTIRSPPALIPLSKTPVPARGASPAVDNNDRTEAVSTPTSEKVPVIASIPSDKNVFASPQPCNSPDRRRTASPLVIPSPKLVNNSAITQKLEINQSEVASKDVNSIHATVSKEKPDCASLSQNKDKKNESAATPLRDRVDEMSDDYSVPSVPESIDKESTDQTVMDGIVPLKKAPKAIISELKNEIISEHAEVLFDPIVPLPSPSKVRPKLRPVPRLAPHRRNSIQGSASESEDESRRAVLNSVAPIPVPPQRQRHESHTSHSTVPSAPNREVNRVRNDSVCSTVSQVATQPPPLMSPVKEKHFSNKARRQEMTRRAWSRRREVKRDALTMYDLIFYNPTTNPIVPNEEEMQAKEANAKEEAERNAKANESSEESQPAEDSAPVPQIKLGANGEIILDEQSLVIKQSDTRKVSGVVVEGAWGGAGGGGRYSRAARTADWPPAETVRFYRALAAIGTDFTLMAQLFPGRSRKDLYLKFKKEERINGGQVDKALRSATAWDPAALRDEFTQERDAAAKRADADRDRLLQKREEERERLRAARELRVRNSRGAKALETSKTSNAVAADLTAAGEVVTAEDFIRRSLEQRKAPNRKPAKRKPTPNPLKLPNRLNTFILPTFNKPPPQTDYATISLINSVPTEKAVPRPPTPTKAPAPSFATLTLMNQSALERDAAPLAEPLVEPPAQPMQIGLNEVAGVPSNIENGSLVVLRVNDPASPSKTMLQTYIAHGAGKLTPVSLPPTFLNSVVGYMKHGTPKSTISTASSPRLASPGSVVSSQESRSGTPSVIVNPSPNKRQRHSSYTITQL